MAAKKGGLGRGFDSLFLDNSSDAQAESGSVSLPIGQIEPDRGQPRTRFDEEALAELENSIREYGVLQPLLVRPMSDGTYRIVAGERRWRAARRAGLTEVPVIIADNLTPEQVKAYRIADNKTAEIAAWDRDALDAEVRELAGMDDDAIASLGMSDWELDRILHECTADDLEEIQASARPQVPAGGAVQPPDVVAQAPVSREQSAEHPDESGCAQSFRIVAVFDTQAERDECVKMIAEKYGESVAIIG